MASRCADPWARMILSYEHNFVFLHSRKTAGSSVTVWLNGYLGPHDIQCGAWPDTIERGGSLNAATKAMLRRYPVESALSYIRHSASSLRPSHDPSKVNELARRFVAEEYGMRGGAHIPARAVRDFDPGFWADSYKFCIVRNPWDHAISDYHWRTRVRRCASVDFTEFLRRVKDPARPDPERIAPPIRSNWEIYTIDDEVAVDFVGRYENLAGDLEHIAKSVGLDLRTATLPNAKGGVREKATRFEQVYDDESLPLVAEIYQKEIDAFGYEPPF